MVGNIVEFPKKFTPPPIIVQAGEIETEESKTHHEQIFEYTDGSYVILVLPKEREFTVERMVFMAERVKRSMFDYAEYECDDEDVATVDDPNNAS